MFDYDNIGSKIKNWAKGIFWVEAIAAVIGGIVLLCEGEVVPGLLVILFGPVAAWMLSWLLYGYGQLIENSDIIAEEYKKVK